MEVRLHPSEPVFAEANTIAFLLSVYKNPQLFWDIDLPEAERLAVIKTLEERWKELFS